MISRGPPALFSSSRGVPQACETLSITCLTCATMGDTCFSASGECEPAWLVGVVADWILGGTI